MVYVDPTELKWLPYVKSWVNTLPEATIKEEYRLQIVELFETYFEEGLVFCHRNCVCPIGQVDNFVHIIWKSKHHVPIVIIRSVTRSILAKQV